MRVAVVAAAALSLGLSACGGGGSTPTGGGGSSGGAGFNAGLTTVVNPSTKQGGTLKFVHPDDFDSLDPGNTYYAFAWDFDRLFGRTLVTYKDVPGKDGLQLVPDLASALGKSSSDAKTWTYTLRTGVKFEDGTPVTSKDVKYAIERTFALDVLSNGPTYFQDLLGDGKYAGPYKDKAGLKSIETPNDQTIVFHLNHPFAEFDFLATLPQTIPVPQAKDTGAKYLEHPIATGPYKVDSYQPGKSLTMSRNPNWSASTDPNRKQLVDSIQVTFKVDANDLDNRLIAGDADIDAAGTGVSPAAQAKILSDPNLKKNADNPLTGFLRYAALSNKVKPLDNIHCRKAVIYAADHEAMQTAYGGPTSGDIATTALPPTVLGYQKADVYGLTTDKNGNIDKAKQELAACGQPNGFKTTIAARANRPKEVAAAEALQQSLSKVGIQTDIQKFPSGQYYSNYAGSTNYAHSHNFGIMFSGWGADWPSGYGFLEQIFDGSAIKSSGNSNLSELNDPAVNQLFTQSLSVTDANKRAEIWTQIDQKVMADAAILPVVYEKTLLYRNPEVSNVFVHQAYGMYSYAPMGISK